MNYQITILLLVLYLSVSCSESISFDTGSDSVVIIDANLSTNGDSYARVYHERGDLVESLDDLSVSIESAGFSHLMEYSESDDMYVLTDGFIPVPDNFYSIRVEFPEGYIITSEGDAVGQSTDFELSISDTTIAASSKENPTGISELSGYAIQATVRPEIDEFYARFKYRYGFLHYYSEDSIYKSNLDDLRLLSCRLDECYNSLEKTVALEANRTWYFQNDSCQSSPSGQCQEPECCILFEDYKLKAEVSMEIMSAETYMFWKEVERLRDNDGLIFDTFPFPIQSNFNCQDCPFEVLGNFRVTSEFKKSKIISL